MKHKIDIPGLPEGWEAVAYRTPNLGEQILDGSEITTATSAYIAAPWLIVKKKQPRRIVLEETEYGNHKVAFMNDDQTWSYWRISEDTSPSLHNADDKESLRLSVDECKQLLGYNDYDPAIYRKLHKFLKDK